MKVLSLRCADGHGFEGWFSGDDDFLQQNGRSMIECPLCGDKKIQQIPAAPRLNLSHARRPSSSEAKVGSPATPVTSQEPPTDAARTDLQAAWLAGVRKLMATTEDVGERFAEEARRIHYGETPSRGIRGQATTDQREALREEGIETVSIPVPRALQGPVQ